MNSANCFGAPNGFSEVHAHKLVNERSSVCIRQCISPACGGPWGRELHMCTHSFIVLLLGPLSIISHMHRKRAVPSTPAQRSALHTYSFTHMRQISRNYCCCKLLRCTWNGTDQNTSWKAVRNHNHFLLAYVFGLRSLTIQRLNSDKLIIKKIAIEYLILLLSFLDK